MKKSRELNMSIPEITDKIDVREISENFEIIDKILSANLFKRNTSTTEINVTAYPPYYIMKNTENNPINYFDPIFEETFTLGPLEEKKFFINAPQSVYITSDVQIEYDYFIPIQEAINDISIPDISASAINGNIKINGTETNVYTHPTGTNPHGTTKSDVGLGNVPNVATNDQTPSYTEASSLAKLTSGEKLSVAFGKISKGVTDLISHLADSVKHITSTERTNWNAAKTKADTNETNISTLIERVTNVEAVVFKDGPIIIKQPEDFTGNVGGTATFSVKAVGFDITYQWESRMKKEDSWSVSGHPGNKTSQLRVQISGSRIGAQYRCVITDKNGKSVISDVGEIKSDATATTSETE